MRAVGCLVLLAGLGGCGGYYYRDSRPVLTVDEVVAMKNAGVDESVILAKIETSRVPGPIQAKDILELKDKGVSDTVAEALVEASAEPAPAVYRRYYGSPYYGYAHPGYPYGYYPYYYGPRYSLRFGYGYPHYYRYPYYRGYRSYRSSPSYRRGPTYRSHPAK